jgi:hypothetical protein
MEIDVISQTAAAMQGDLDGGVARRAATRNQVA